MRHRDLFDQVFATNEQVNLSSQNKRDGLIAEYDEKGFNYLGNSHDDISVCAAAVRAHVVYPFIV